MSSKPEQEHEARPEREGRDARIRQRVMHTFGQHDLPYAVQVRRLWGDHYRVNVFLGADGTSARIAPSYFVQADAEGNIIDSTPRLQEMN